MSIFDVVPTQEQDDAQPPEAAAPKQLPDRAESPRPTASAQGKGALKQRRPSWEVAEADRTKQFEINSQPTSYQSSPSTSDARIKVGTFRRRATRTLLAVLVVVLIFFVIQGFFTDIEGFLAERTVAGGSLHVKGILYDYTKGNSSALVNRKIVHEGDKISGATVIRINRDSVEFELAERWPSEGPRRVTKRVRR
jgi:hypothetical protein